MTTATLHLLIHGRVQGVGYRVWAGAKARSLGLHGWVRNRRDGTVEALISGPDELVQEMLAACYDGPMVARVDEIIVKPWAEDLPQGFSKLETV